jgi:hypothetical protein
VAETGVRLRAVEEPPAPPEEASEGAKVTEALKGLTERVGEGNSALQEILTDPLVREVLEARRAGRDVVVRPVEEPEDRSGDSPPDLESMTNTDLTRYIVQGVLKELGPLVKKEVEPIGERLQAVETAAQASLRKTVSEQIAGLSARYPDFPQYEQEMIALRKGNPGLSLEQLYVLARMGQGKLEIPEGSPSSERPTTAPVRRPLREGSPPVRRGAGGFAQLLQGALDRLEIPE